MLTQVEIGDRLKSARRGAGLSQNAVAASMDLQRSAISLIESGNRVIKGTELQALCNLYGISPMSILGADIGEENIGPRHAIAIREILELRGFLGLDDTLEGWLGSELKRLAADAFVQDKISGGRFRAACGVIGVVE